MSHVINRSRIVFVADLLWPAAMGGEMSAITLMRDLAKQHDVTAIYRRTFRPDKTCPKDIHFVFTPDCFDKSLRQIVSEYSPDLLIVSWTFWRELADYPCKKMAYVCYWSSLVKEPQMIHLGIDPLEDSIECLKKYNGFIASSFFTKSVLLQLGFPSKDISVIQPRLPMFIRNGTRSDVLVIGKEKHRGDVLRAIDAKVIPYDTPNFTLLNRDQMSELYSNAAVLAHPTFLSESFCLTAVEAMKNGVPIVYTAEGNLPGLIGHLAGIPLPIDASPQTWKAAIEQAKKEQWRGEYGKRRAAWMEKYDDSQEAIQSGVNHLLADQPCGMDINICVPDFPGCYTAVQEMTACHSLRYSETIPNSWRNLILGALSKPWFKELPTLNQKGNLAVWWHSNLNQSDFTQNEFKLLKEVVEVMKKGDLSTLFVTDEGFAEVLSRLGLPAYWLPDVAEMPKDPPATSYHRTSYPRIAMFGDETARKNHATSLGAALLANAEANFFPRLLQTDRLEHLVNVLGVKYSLHEYSFKDKESLESSLRQMTCAVLPTHAETFCYAAAEAILAGTPIIGSLQVPFLQNLDDDISVLEDLNDVRELASKIRTLHRDPELRRRIAERQFYELEEINFRNRLASRKALTRFLTATITVKQPPTLKKAPVTFFDVMKASDKKKLPKTFGL